MKFSLTTFFTVKNTIFIITELISMYLRSEKKKRLKKEKENGDIVQPFVGLPTEKAIESI